MNPRGQPRVNLSVADRDFKYYIFDWDDNILHMPTRIHLEKRQADGSWAPHLVSTSLFSVIRADTANYRPPGGEWKRAFVEFQDDAPGAESAFLRDTREAIGRVIRGEEAPGPSFRVFHRTLVEGRIFAIVTARGHASGTIEQGVRLFLDLVLTPAEREEMLANLRGYRACFDHVTHFGGDREEIDYYLGLNRYHAVTSPDFLDRLRREGSGSGSAEAGKQFAIRDFVEHVIRVLGRTRRPDGLRRPISVGFSDDDPANVAAADAFIRDELARHFAGVKFCVYDTSDPELDRGRKVVVAGQMDFGF
jgi:hypothetical protein